MKLNKLSRQLRKVTIILIWWPIFTIVSASAQQPVQIAIYKALPTAKTWVKDKAGEVLYYNAAQKLINNDHIESAEVDYSPYHSQPEIRLTLTAEGRQIFATITKEQIGKKLLIFLNDSLLLAPVVQSEISGGKLSITGNLTLEDAKQYAVALNHGKPIASIPTENFEKDSLLFITLLDSAFVTKNEVMLDEFLHPEVLIVHSNGWQQNKEDIVNDLLKGKVIYESIKTVNIEDIAVEDKVARIVRTAQVKGYYKQQPFEMKLKIMEIWTAKFGKVQLWSREAVQLQ